MSSNHNDLATWAGKARARGFNFIEIDCDTAEDVAEEIVDQANEIADLQARVQQLEEALTPSADTKAAYAGEFYMGVTLSAGGEEDYRRVQVPWTTIKEIMAAIRGRANGGSNG